MKLYVNIPRYRRIEIEQEDGMSKEVRNQHIYEHVKKKNKEVWRQKKGKEVRRVNKGKQSYVDVVRRTSQEKWKGPIVETQQQVLP